MTTIISESGVYSLAFTSRKEAAKRFKRRVTHEVLPTLRRTGRYEIAPAGEEPVQMDAALLTAKNGLVRTAMKLGGPRAGRALWEHFGLPAVYDRLAAPADERVLMILREAGALGLSRTDLSRKTQWLDGEAVRSAVISRLMAAGKIELRASPTIGRPKTVYRATA